MDINPNYSTAGYPTGYPGQWHFYTLVITGLPGPTQGRFAFRYFVEDGGNAGSHSQAIGIDSVVYRSILDLGMQEENENNMLSVYPNPSQNIFNFRCENAIEEIGIKNTLGQNILVSSKDKIDLSQFAEGVYFCCVRTRKGIFNTKIVKQ